MSVGRFLRTPCTILTTGTPGEVDDFGEPLPVKDEETPTRCRIVHERSIELRDGGVVAVDELRCYLPADLDPLPTATARLRARGVEYAFEGGAHVVDNPRTNRVAYIEAKLRAVT